VDRTPTSPVRPRQQPNRKFEHRNGPSTVVVGGLLLVALVVGLVLWVTMGTEDGAGLGVATTPAPNQTPDVTTGVVPAAAGGAIVGVRTFDPDGDEVENDDLVALATDNDLDTAWTTVCYGDRYLGGKNGVGLVADLGANHTGLFSAAIGSAPFQLRVFGAPDGQLPTTFADWGPSLRSFNGTAPASVSVQLDTPVRYVLVSFNELGSNNNCANNPFRGSIQELTLSSS
jgi:hypothetical protein